MYKNLTKAKKVSYCGGLKNNVKEYIKSCDTCQRSKYENLSPSGLLQPLTIPDQTWKEITMDFIDCLRRSLGRSAIFVLVDRLTKYAHFIPLSHPYTSKVIAGIFVDNIYKLYGLPKIIISDRDSLFLSGFWQEFWILQGSKLCFSTAYHPQTDRQRLLTGV